MSMQDELTSDEKLLLMARIGEMFLRLPATAKLAGHERAFEPASSYLRVRSDESKIESLAKQFVIDMSQHACFRMSFEELYNKWMWLSPKEAVEDL